MIGVAIITCDRPDFFIGCLASIPRNEIDYLVVVDDGTKKIQDSITGDVDYYLPTNPGRSGVGNAKHLAVQELVRAGCDHIFIIEDDIIVTDLNVFNAYIKASKVTGIQHFMFGYHGPANKAGISKGKPCPKYRYRYDNETVVAINQHCVGAFCYYTKKCFDAVGNFDLTYDNAFEHIDHSYLIAKAGMTTPYWNWADLDNSWQMLDELACSEENSSIRGQDTWQANIQKGALYFMEKHGAFPWGTQGVQDIPEAEVKKILKEIHEKYSNRD